MKVFRLIPAAFVLGFLALPANAYSSPGNAIAEDAPRHADSPECKEITARLVQATGAQFERIASLGDDVFLKHPLASRLVLSSATHRLMRVSLGWNGPFPSNAWFALAVKAGHAVTGADFQLLETAISKCHHDALNDNSESAELEVPNATIECQAFTRDGGGASMSIWINDHQAGTGIGNSE